MGDAATPHKSMVKNAEYSLAFCWAPGRPKFIRAKQFLDKVAQLYAIGQEGDELRSKLRNEKSRPVVENIREWLIGQRFLPCSDIGAAIKYIAARWDGLCVFL